MAQIFHRSTNTLSRVSLFGALFFVGAALWGMAVFNRSSYMTRVAVARPQPVQFSHRHHAGELGIDCRYCHTSVEVSAVAGVPPMATCMNCHSQIWLDSAYLAPVRDAYRTGRSLEWVKVNDLPDFVYFHHAIHVEKGIGCATCHGRIDRMDQLFQASSLQMEWCLECHRHPERFVRPKEHVFDMAWEPPADVGTALGLRLVKEYDIHTRTDCDTCHR